MKHANIKEMYKGWFVGEFEPTAFSTSGCEVAVKCYKAGEKEVEHFHKIATEITMIISGSVKMAGCKWFDGDIIVLNPGESTSFEALEDSVTVVVKVPGVSNDKYITKLSPKDAP